MGHRLTCRLYSDDDENSSTFGVLDAVSIAGFLELEVAARSFHSTSGDANHHRVQTSSVLTDATGSSILARPSSSASVSDSSRVVFKSDSVVANVASGNFSEESGLEPPKQGVIGDSVLGRIHLRSVSSPYKQVEAIKYGVDTDLILSNAIIDMYGKCSFCGGAQSVFDKLPQRDVMSWTSLVSAYVNYRLSVKGLQVFHEMHLSGNKPNAVIVSTVLHICLFRLNCIACWERNPLLCPQN